MDDKFHFGGVINIIPRVIPVVLKRIIKKTVRMECKENKKTANNNMND